MKYFTFFFFTFILFSSCGSDPKSNDEGATAVSGTDTDKAMEDLRKNALAEDDYFGRVERSLVTLQNEFKKAEGKVPGVGRMTVFLDKHYTLLLKNEVGGDIIETQVSLKHLNPNNGGMTLVPDNEAGQFPGVKLHVLSGRDGVEIRKNGEVESEERELSIYLADRESVEKVVPALVQALNIVHKKME